MIPNGSDQDDLLPKAGDFGALLQHVANSLRGLASGFFNVRKHAFSALNLPLASLSLKQMAQAALQDAAFMVRASAIPERLRHSGC